ncbi:unnamed protein product [Trypanosoma congolense IL3000]|uniref:WGS project CAEQ00000000 data, annotated contig 1403 n=1 Tax=Trypanosoma congolense (strain IL3000) TaxID=1068625 RepID=F9W5Y6_TRYCI|nr:unnamed protein product [Trypanosoma congolense IL3000]
MEMKAGLVWWVMVGVLVLFSKTPRAWEPSRQAIHTEAGESICSLSNKLKDVTPWAQQEISALRKMRDAHASKFLEWQLHFHGSPACKVNESLLEDIRTDLEKVNEEIEKLSEKAIRAGALAAKSAGRLDEFITVFARAKMRSVFDTSNYCLGRRGDPATRTDLFNCFPTGVEIEMGENNLAKIPESVPEKNELDFRTAIEAINHSTFSAHLMVKYGDDNHAGCNLINGKSGILSVALQDRLWWGGGILTIGKASGEK